MVLRTTSLFAITQVMELMRGGRLFRSFFKFRKHAGDIQKAQKFSTNKAHRNEESSVGIDFHPGNITKAASKSRLVSDPEAMVTHSLASALNYLHTVRSLPSTTSLLNLYTFLSINSLSFLY